MGLISGNDLEEAGWPPSKLYIELLDAAAQYEDRGVTDKSYLLKLLDRDFEKPDQKLKMRPEALPFAEAIAATCEEDEGNIGAVRRFMGQLLKTPVIEAGSVMPDACPAGSAEATIPVGGAISVKNAILPAAHSADVCCSMYATVFTCEKSVEEMLDAMMESTRFGSGGRATDDLVEHPVINEDVWDNKFLNGLQRYAAIHMADQGDGNHFAYLGKIRVTLKLIQVLESNGYREIANALKNKAGNALASEDEGIDFYTLVTHHGSRGLGAHLYKRGHKAAIRETARVADGIPNAAAWLDMETPLGQEYWEALQYVGRWTLANHQSIHARFLERTEAAPITEFGNEHNFVWKRGDDQYLHGKGATPAWKDETGRPLLGLIPLNMSEPILVTLGRDNEDFLSFAPHGAGRNRSRTATMKRFRTRKGRGELDKEKIAEEIANSTQGLDIRWYHGKADLSESPIGYKNAQQVRDQIDQFGLADVIAEVTPLGCIMAGDPGPKIWERKKEELTPKQKRQIVHRSDRRKTRQRMKDQDLMGED